MSDDKVTIELSASEALVLFEFVYRFTQNDKLELVDHAEERVLWSVCNRLETILVEPFLENYIDLLAKAREEVREK